MYQSPFCPLLPIRCLLFTILRPFGTKESIRMLCKNAFFFFHNLCVYIVCVCVLFFSHTPKAKTQNLFFLLGVGEDIICKRDRWWVYWLLIIYTLLLPWQFFTLIYIFLRNVEIFNFQFIFPPSNKKIVKENIEHSKKFYLFEMIFQMIYLFIWQTLVQPTKVLQYMILLLDVRINYPSKKKQFGGILEKIYLFKVLFF